MREFYSFDREEFSDLIIDTVHGDEMRRIAEAFVSDKEDRDMLLGSFCDDVMDTFNDFLDKHRKVVFIDDGTGRWPLDTGTLMGLMAGVFGQKNAIGYCRMRAFELLASGADMLVREKASEYLALASKMAGEAREG